MATKKAKAKTNPKPKAKAKATASVKPNQSRENLRKVFLAGLGLADEANVKFQQTFDQLVKRGQTKQPQVKKAVADIRKKVLARRKEIEKRFTDFAKQNELLKSKEIQEVRKNFEKKFSEYAKQSKLLKSKEVQEVAKKWEKKFSDYVKQSGVLKNKEVQALRKKLEQWEAKAKEWEANAKETAKKATATPVTEEKKRWTPSAPQPVVAEPAIEKEEIKLESSDVTL